MQSQSSPFTGPFEQQLRGLPERTSVSGNWVLSTPRVTQITFQRIGYQISNEYPVPHICITGHCWKHGVNVVGFMCLPNYSLA